MGVRYIRGSAKIKDGTAARTFGMVRNKTAATAGQGLSFDAGGAVSGGTNLNGGNAKIKGGTATGTGTSGVEFWGATAGSSGTADAAAALLATLNPTGLAFKGEAARTVGMDRILTAATAGQGFTIDAGGAVSGGTNKAGGDLTLKSGISTGNTNSAILMQTPAAGGSGTGSNAVATRVTVDENGVSVVGNVKATGVAARTFGMARNTTANTAGQGAVIDAGGATSGSTDKDGGDLTLKSGVAAGNNGSSIVFQSVAAGQGAGTTDRSPVTGLTLTGTKALFAGETEIDGALNHDGTTAGFLGATPVAQAANTPAGSDAATTQTLANALRTIAINLGFMAA